MLQSHKESVFEALGRNPIHPFPARMAPGIALDALGDGKEPLKILDPMVGSGTVLAVAKANGHRAIGFDLDPLAVLLAGVWTRAIDAHHAVSKAEEVLQRAKTLLPHILYRNAYPPESDEDTRRFIRYWFDDYARRQLSSLSTAIRRVRDDVTRDALWVAFSRLIITKSSGSSRAMDLSHSRPHRKFLRAPTKPFNRFMAAVDVVVSNCPQAGTPLLGPIATAKLGDARKMNIADSSIDLVLTSPPYLNAIDYMRCSKFSLVWMGHNVGEIRAIRSGSVGAESASEIALAAPWVQALVTQVGLRGVLSSRDQALLARYVWDMGEALAEVSRVLKSGGRAVYVVGDSVSRGAFIPNSSIVLALAQERGLTPVSHQSRELPANRRYLPPPRIGNTDSMDGRLRREVVLGFVKS